MPSLVSIYPADKIGDKEMLGLWQNLKTLVWVDSHTCHVSENGREETQTRYYISDEDFP